MSGNYVNITFEEFNNFVAKYGFQCINPQSVDKEYTYDFSWAGGVYLIRIYSSITPHTSLARGIGQDAIRLSLMVEMSPFKMKGVWAAPRTHRIETWRQNLQPKIAEALHRGCFDQPNYECKF